MNLIINSKKNLIKAQGHVEMILSFLVFMFFLFLLFSLLNPSKNKDVDSMILDVTSNAIIKQISSQFNTSTLILTEESGKEVKKGGGNCFFIQIPNFFDPVSNIVVRNYEDKEKPSSLDNLNLYIRFDKNKDQNFYRLYSSGDLEPELLPSELSRCAGLINPDHYTLVNPDKKIMINAKKAEELETDYSDNYLDLQQTLDINNEFSFYLHEKSFDEDTGGIIDDQIIAQGGKEPPFNSQVLSKDIPVSIIKQDAEIKFGILNIRTW